MPRLTGMSLNPPGLTPGYTMVHKKYRRARYKPSTDPKGTPYYTCLNKASCRSLYGGTDHSIQRGGQRAEAGVYKGVYGKTGKLLSAKVDLLLLNAPVYHHFGSRRDLEHGPVSGRVDGD